MERPWRPFPRDTQCRRQSARAHRDADATEADRPTFEAEGAAHAVLSYFGADASGYSFAYVARRAEGKEVVKTALSSLQAAVRTIVGAVEDGKL